MNALRNAQEAYGQTARTIKTPRSTEYEAFAHVTSTLKASPRTGPGAMARLAGALHDNRRLWTILAADVAGDANALSADIRAQIVYLAEFTHLHSARVLSEGAPITPLVDINTAIMAGLRGQGQTP